MLLCLYFGATTATRTGMSRMSPQFTHTLLMPTCCCPCPLVDSSSLSTAPICQVGRRRRRMRRRRRRRKDAPSSSRSTGLWRRLPFHLVTRLHKITNNIELSTSCSTQNYSSHEEVNALLVSLINTSSNLISNVFFK